MQKTLLPFSTAVNDCVQTVTRAAIELGSGCIRLQVADVDAGAQKITKVHLIHYMHVDFAKDLKIGEKGAFSQEIMARAISAVKELKNMALAFSPDCFCAVATEAFRCSKNGQELVQQIAQEAGVNVEIATHEQEALYGFFNAMSLSGIEHNSLISWDSGAGSFQLAAYHEGGLEMFLGRFGRIPVQHYIIETLQKRDYSKTHSPNPITEKEAMQTVSYIKSQLQSCPQALISKIHTQDSPVICVGAHPRAVDLGICYSQEDIKALLFASLNKSDDEFSSDEPQFIVSDLILAYSVMTALGIKKAVRYSSKFAGNTSGLLINSDLWPLA